MKIKIELPDKRPFMIFPKDVTEHYATEVCKQYGWGRESPVWWDLANSTHASQQFLVEYAKKMYPGATVKIVE
jgi:hypothetical protein